MIVFHTPNIPVPQPDVLHSRKYLDFGQGFYVTPTNACLTYLKTEKLK